MPQNLELKVRLNDFNEINMLLKKNKVKHIHTLNQKDIYYKISGGLLKLRIENGKQSIIKYLRDETGKNRFSDYEVLTFESGDTEKFFKELFEIEAVVEKTRELFLHDNTRIHLDSVTKLGNFLELETLVINGKNDAKTRFSYTKEFLRLEKYNEIRKSYRDLIIDLRNRNDFNKV